MNIWVVMAVLLGITGFYVFLSLYLLGHLVAKAVRKPRSSGRAETSNQKSLEPLIARIKEQAAGSVEP